MKQRTWCGWTLVGLILWAGCNNSQSDSPTAQSPGATSAEHGAGSADLATTVKAGDPGEPGTLSVSPAADQLSSGEPADAVSSFLSALQSGQSAAAFGMITSLAQQEMSQAGMSPSPVGSPNSQYKVGRTEFVTPEKDGAYVSSIWTEGAGQESSDEFEIVWVLRKEDAGWRIAGMASEVVPGEAPLFLDFENPGEMQQKLTEAEQTIAAANEGPQVRQAQNIQPIDGEFSPK